MWVEVIVRESRSTSDQEYWRPRSPLSYQSLAPLTLP
jgi:hypothetical protein